MKNIKGTIILPLLAAAGIGFLLSYGKFSPSTVNPREVETAIQNAVGTDPSMAGLFVVIKEEFSADYDEMIQDVTDRVNSARAGTSALEAEVFNASRSFAVQLRQENAHYLNSAPTEDVRAIAQAQFEAMQSVSDDRDLCVRFATSGGATLTLADLEKIDIAKVAAVGEANFRAMAAGRDAPVTRTPATEQEIQKVLSQWQAQPDVTSGMANALLSGDMADPDFCASQVSFQGYIAQAADPVGERVMITLTAFANGM